MALASLRFSGLREVLDFRTSDTAVCGVSVDQKDKHGALINWATPALGLNGNTNWFQPLLSFWGDVTVNKSHQDFHYISPAVNKDWKILPKAGTNGTAQTCLGRIEKLMGRSPLLKLHSFRSFMPTCAGQLQYDLDKRRKLGRWSATSTMPDRYDRSVCATELATRSGILTEMSQGWRPAREFEIPDAPGIKLGSDSDSVASETSDGTLSSKEVDISKLDE